MDRKERTGKLSRKQTQKVDHHFLLQREFKEKAKKAARDAKRK
jgi:hypothetical protein